MREFKSILEWIGFAADLKEIFELPPDWGPMALFILLYRYLRVSVCAVADPSRFAAMAAEGWEE